MSMRPPPTTFELMEAVALRAPRRTAIVDGPESLSYGECRALVVRLTRLLDQLGIRPGQRVALSRPSFALQLLMLIACENLGAVTACFLARDDSDAPALFGIVDWVLSELPQDCPEGVRFQRIDQAFIDQPLPDGGGAYPRIARELHMPERIVRTSGSSGTAKFMEVSRQGQENFTQGLGGASRYGTDSRVLIASPLVLNAGYIRSCSCLRHGATVLALDGGELEGVALTHVWGLPIRLEELLDELPAGFQPRRGVLVHTMGGAVAPRLHERLLHFFGGPVVNVYGANETGAVIDTIDQQGTGLLRAGADVRILDAEGREVPAGETGLIVLRTPSMAGSYIGRPQESARAFRDGWFHTGDWGRMAGHRMLQVAGRHDDLLNLAGIKVPAFQVEEQIRKLVPVRDCAVLAVHLDGGATTLGIVVAAGPGTEREPIMRRIAQELVLPAGAKAAARIVFVEELPQGSGGKLDRVALQKLLRA